MKRKFLRQVRRRFEGIIDLWIVVFGDEVKANEAMDAEEDLMSFIDEWVTKLMEEAKKEGGKQ